MDPKVFQAASSGDSSFFENSQESWSDIQVTTGKNTVLHVALQFEQFEAATRIVQLFPSLVYKQNSRGNTPLHIAARIGNLPMVELLLDQDKIPDIETGVRQTLCSMVNLDGDTALHVAVRHGKFVVVKKLIIACSEPLANQINNAGESALFLAVDRQSYKMASLILDLAPDCSYSGRHGMNVLHALVIHTSTYSNMYESVFPRLSDIEDYKKQRKKARSRSRRLLLITFVWVVNMLCLIPLPNLLEDPSEKHDNTQDKDDMRFCRFGTIPTDLVENVIRKWSSTVVVQYDDSGWTPLHIAAHLGNVEFVQLILEMGSSPAYVLNKEGLSAFHIAAKEGNYRVMRILMEACPDIYELLDKRGRNALHTAAESGSWSALYVLGNGKVFEYLVNEQDEEGNTPSHLAAINGHTDMAMRLGKGGEIVLNATNKEGFTTMDNVLLTSKLHSLEVKQLYDMGARLSLRGVLLKIGILNLDPRKKAELAGAGDGDGDYNGKSRCVSSGNGDGDGDGNDEGMSYSDFLKQVREGNMLVATLIATVTFTAAFTVPGGFNQSGNAGEGMAVLSKITAFRVFLIANSLAFGLSATSVFVHFLALTRSEEIAFHRKIGRRTDFYTNWSIGAIGAMLVAFIAGTYAVVPHSWGIAVAGLLSWCFLSSLFLPVTQ